jgi:hypothetical protein
MPGPDLILTSLDFSITKRGIGRPLTKPTFSLEKAKVSRIMTISSAIRCFIYIVYGILSENRSLFKDSISYLFKSHR